jgi:hypothetical protein
MLLKPSVVGVGLGGLLWASSLYAVDCRTSFDNSCLPKENGAAFVEPPPLRQNVVLPRASQLTADQLQLQVLRDEEAAQRELLEQERTQRKEQARIMNAIDSPPAEEIPIGLTAQDMPAFIERWRVGALAQAYANIDADINERLEESWTRVIGAEQELAARYAGAGQ